MSVILFSGSRPAAPRILWDAQRTLQHFALKRVALKRIQATRFKSLFLCMSFSQNRCALLRDMH
ncbi:hypothetical protein RFM99_16590 [Mesorhizobium sp. VK4C]|uniref:hypothetical protein n=1 Tax=Mesorhizobium captivum TaxID=3072319 RepID=UPI002A23B4EC|nr:hypothetical protein [Mesorhizobium sp. VK4C]MDX8500027.1 hypothetical protein [Mesorhizobium sp. VK4C]